MLDIDGSYGTGGGQLVRNAVALAALTGTAVRIRSIRAKRDKPGLAPQHLTALRAVGEICGARIDGLAPRSNEIAFDPGPVRGGRFAFDVGTAGSVTLVLQALLSLMIAARAGFQVEVAGGTDVRAAPPLDYLREVLLPIIARMGADVRLATRRRGYFPHGGGVVEVAVTPGVLRPLRLDAPGRLLRVDGLAHVAHLPAHIAERMRSSALGRLGTRAALTACDTAILQGEEGIGQGGSGMSREQAAPKRGATERAQRRRRNAPASLCCFAGTVAPPAPREAGMRPAAIVVGRRQRGGCTRERGAEAAA